MERMKRKLTIPALLAMTLFLAAALLLSGCDMEPKTLEDYLTDSPSAQQEIEESLSGISNNDMNVSVSYEGNRIIISCAMKTTYKKKILKTMKKSYRKYLSKNLKDPMEKAIASIEKETGITGVGITIIVSNGNGKEIWSQDYPLEEPVTETAPSEKETDKQDTSGSLPDHLLYGGAYGAA